MNTPAHAVLNLLLLAPRGRPDRFGPVALGAVLPDLPMVAFYLYERLGRGTPEITIWSERYHHPGWQAIFDSFHSLPLLALACLLFGALGAPRGAILCASMALHALGDVPLHHDDAHRHFFPLSEWRFLSPVSYWDPRAHGEIFLWLETALVAAGTALLLHRHPRPRARALTLSLAALYALFLVFALTAWA